VPQKIFLDYDSAELDRQYDQRVWAANALAVIARYGEASDSMRARLGEPMTAGYGDAPSETLDIYRTARPHAPIQVFVHGGAWRMLGKRESAFPAGLFVELGAHFIALDFALLPQVRLGDMVAQVRRAVAWIYRNAGQFGGDRDRIFVSGHSSGAHLAANIAVTDWRRIFDLPADIVSGAVCVSGIYDLEPVRLSARSRYVILDDESEHALSPIRHLDRLTCPIVVAHGELESDEFRRQSRDFAAALRARGSAVDLFEAPGLNHFEIAETLAQPEAPLARRALAQMGLA
jgi:arylformamidase